MLAEITSTAMSAGRLLVPCVQQTHAVGVVHLLCSRLEGLVCGANCSCWGVLCRSGMVWYETEVTQQQLNGGAVLDLGAPVHDYGWVSCILLM